MKTPIHSFDDFDNIPTVVIPAETMIEVREQGGPRASIVDLTDPELFGEGHAPSGPSKPTRDLRAFSVSDGVPEIVEEVATDRTEPSALAS